MLQRFLSDNSYWNTPIGRKPEVDPDSERLLGLMAKSTNGFWINPDYWTIPVYEVSAETPCYEVLRFLSARHRGVPRWLGSTDPDAKHHDLGHTRDFNPVPIPMHAVPFGGSRRRLAIRIRRRGGTGACAQRRLRAPERISERGQRATHLQRSAHRTSVTPAAQQARKH
jgi:hypothetical protein